MRDESLTVTGTARLLGIRIDTTYLLIRGGQIEAEKRDGRWLVSRQSAEHYAKNRLPSGPRKSLQQAEAAV